MPYLEVVEVGVLAWVVSTMGQGLCALRGAPWRVAGRRTQHVSTPHSPHPVPHTQRYAPPAPPIPPSAGWPCRAEAVAGRCQRHGCAQRGAGGLTGQCVTVFEDVGRCSGVWVRGCGRGGDRATPAAWPHSRACRWDGGRGACFALWFMRVCGCGRGGGGATPAAWPRASG